MLGSLHKYLNAMALLITSAIAFLSATTATASSKTCSFELNGQMIFDATCDFELTRVEADLIVIASSDEYFVYAVNDNEGGIPFNSNDIWEVYWNEEPYANKAHSYLGQAKLVSEICLKGGNFLACNVVVNVGCKDDPNECTPKKLCAIATEITDGVTLWSASTDSSKHVSFAQELGMNCGVVELKDPCETDPNECKIKQLCEKATIEDGGTKSWNSGAKGYVTVAQEYGLECGVGELSSSTKAVQSTGGEVSCTLKSLQGCSEDYICTRATYFNSRDQNRQWAYGLYTDEANRRGLTCGVGETKSAGGSEVFSSWSDALICKYVKIGLKKHIQEAKSRGLTCDADTQSAQQRCSYATPKFCNDKQVCDSAVVADGSFEQKYKKWSKHATTFVAEAKARGLSCNVKIKYDLKRYDTWESTNTGYEGNIGIDDASGSKGTDRFYSWASGGHARFWTDYDPDQTYYSDAYTSTVFPKLTSAFKQKSKSDRQRIQRNLKNKGLYESTIDGLWGRNTLVALTDYSSKRLRTIRLTDPQIVQTLMDQILRDTSSGDVGLANSEVINEIYAHLENIQKNEEKSYAFESIFKNKSTLKRKQIQYALRYLGYYNSGIDGLWGNGTRKALASFASATNLTNSQPDYVISHLLSLVDAPSSFDAPQQNTSSLSSSSNSNSNSYKTYYKGMRPLISNPSASAEQAWAICEPQARLASNEAQSNSQGSGSRTLRCKSTPDFLGGTRTRCAEGSTSGGWPGLVPLLLETDPASKARRAGERVYSATMDYCLAKYGWKR